MNTLPLLPFVLVGGLVLAVAVARPLGRWLASPWWVAFVLVAGLAAIVAITLTPVRFVPGAVDPASIVPEVIGGPLWRWPWQWWPVADRTLNIVLFVPVGFAAALVGRRALRWGLVALALALPWIVEVTQYVVDWLNRDAQWQDVVDNTTGVVIGLVAGALVGRSSRTRAATPA